MSGPTPLTTPTTVKKEPRSSVDEEDELLYGELSAVLKMEERSVGGAWCSLRQ